MARLISGNIVSGGGGSGLTAGQSTKVNFLDTIDEGITATGANHADGYDITKATTRFTTVTSVAYAAALPELSTVTAGRSYRIHNDDPADTLHIFPEASDDAGSGAGVAIKVLAGGSALFIALDATNWKVLVFHPSVQSEYTASGTAKEYELVNGSVSYLSLAAGLSLAMPSSLERPEDLKWTIINRTGTNTIKPPTGGVFDMDGTLLDANDRISLAAGKMANISKRTATGTYVVTSDGATDAGPA